MGMPGFTAEASIYKSMRNYRMKSTVFPEMGNATVSMAVRLNCSIQGTEIVCEIGGGGGGGDGGDGGGGGGDDGFVGKAGAALACAVCVAGDDFDFSGKFSWGRFFSCIICGLEIAPLL